MKRGESMKIVNLKLEDELHKEFKTKVVADGSNMQDVLIKLIQIYLKEGYKNR